MKADTMHTLLDENKNMRDLLFPRGMLLTDDESVDADRYPFYGRWRCTNFCGYRLFIHPKQKLYTVTDGRLGFALVGHAFNPLSSEDGVSEERMLEQALKRYQVSKADFIKYFNQWTGLFALFIFDAESFCVYGDAAGMYTVFYGVHNGKTYCASHTNLLGDICHLEFDEYINRLIHYRFYSLFGKALPGDCTPYVEFKRLIPNHAAKYEAGRWTAVRFFPTSGNALLKLPYDEIIDRSAKILSRSMETIHKKWDRPAVSLTGGCDSKTTLACTNGVYDKYRYFSYISSESESVDAEAAAKICEMLKIPHRIYQIPNSGEELSVLREIIAYNSGSIGKSNENDVRKRAFFLQQDDFDVEVKSWVSEIARAYYHKRFAKNRFPSKLTPRYATSLYKVFITDRKLVRDTDKIFEAFLNKYYANDSFDLIPWQDLFFWEFRMSSWNGLVITGEQQIAYDIAIPYNNRVFLQLMLSTPAEKRVKDEPHYEIMRKMNQKIADCGISVVNVKHTKNRAKLERLYLVVSSKLPF